MNRVTIMAIVCLTLATGPVLALTPNPENPPVPARCRGTVEKKSQGKVTEYVAGRSLTIAMEGEKTYTLELNEKDVAASVAPGIGIGSHVRVVESRDPTGKRSVTVMLAAAPAENR